MSNVKMGSMHVGPVVGWRMMEERLRATLQGYLSQLDVGLRTRRIARMEAEATDKEKSSVGERDFTLGLTMANIKQFEMGMLCKICPSTSLSSWPMYSSYVANVNSQKFYFWYGNLFAVN